MIVESYEDVVILSGDLRQNHWETIHTAISLVLKRHSTGVIIDCSGLGEVDEQGAETFLDAINFIQDHRARVLFAAVPENVMEVLKQVPEVRSRLAVSRTVEEARRSLDLTWENPEGKKKRKLHTPENARKIIVCLYDGTSVEEDNAAMHLASQIADSEPSVIHLVCCLLVSRDLPLTAALPQQEASAANAIERAKQFFDHRGIPHFDRIERGRDVASALLTAAEAIQAKDFVLPVISDPRNSEQSLKVITNVLAKVRGQVIFVRG